jgi:hypothetical protein
MTETRYTCPCCGYRTLSSSPGNYDICHVCFWEDDPIQILDPWYQGGANKISLEEAQKNYAEIGASEDRFKSNVKGVLPGDVRDSLWRRAMEMVLLATMMHNYMVEPTSYTLGGFRKFRGGAAHHGRYTS